MRIAILLIMLALALPVFSDQAAASEKDSGMTLSGRVLNITTGKPISNAKINVFIEDKELRTKHDYYLVSDTDENGYYFINGLVEGTDLLFLRLPNGRSVFRIHSGEDVLKYWRFNIKKV